MSVKFSNNAVTTLSAGISAGATSFTVASASTFPTLGASDWTYVSLTSEVVKVTAISGTTFTCDATSGAHSSGATVELRMTAELLNDVALGDDESLDAISNASAITGNAVDVFIYDTSNDSDGGAWRKRTQATSWYNETLNTATRGSRKEFPSVAVIVAEASKVTIYDGDTPDLDMWMVFNQVGSNASQPMIGSLSQINTSITAINGILAVSGTSGGNISGAAKTIHFLKDAGYFHLGAAYHSGYGGWFNGSIAQRNLALNFDNPENDSIISRDANDVAMTVLPNAPIDSTTGLPIPTILVGCRQGLSVIKDDGTVINRTPGTSDGVTGGVYNVAFDVNGGYWYSNSYYGETQSLSSHAGIICYATSADATGALATAWVPTHTEVRLSMGSDDGGTTTHWATTPTAGLWQNHGGKSTVANAGKMSIVSSGDSSNVYGVHKFLSANIPQSSSSVAYLTSTYNSGYMTGDIKGAWLSDTDTTNVVGTELVTNGSSFTNTTGYTALSGAGLSVVSSKIHVVGADSGDGTYGLSYAVSTTVGKTYVFNAIANATNYWVPRVGTTSGGSDLALGVSAGSGLQSRSLTVTATGTTTYVTVYVYGSGASADITSFSVKLADSDRSVNANGLQVNGTITKTAVATGADLVGYGGFSDVGSGVFLEQPYNSDLDFGTGDFSYMGWVKTSAQTHQAVVHRAPPNEEGVFLMQMNSSGLLTIANSTSTQFTVFLTGTVPINTGGWVFISVRKANGIVYSYVNGVLDVSVSNNTTMTNNTAITRIGARQDYANEPWASGSLALWRASATAPTAAQIKEIYEAEKPLFQENGKCVLHGTSDAVTALAYDDSTSELVVATSGGLSVFKGLSRVDEEDGNFTEVSQQGGMRIVEKA